MQLSLIKYIIIIINIVTYIDGYEALWWEANLVQVNRRIVEDGENEVVFGIRLEHNRLEKKTICSKSAPSCEPHLNYCNYPQYAVFPLMTYCGQRHLVSYI